MDHKISEVMSSNQDSQVFRAFGHEAHVLVSSEQTGGQEFHPEAS